MQVLIVTLKEVYFHSPGLKVKAAPAQIRERLPRLCPHYWILNVWTEPGLLNYFMENFLITLADHLISALR